MERRPRAVGGSLSPCLEKPLYRSLYVAGLRRDSGSYGTTPLHREGILGLLSGKAPIGVPIWGTVGGGSLGSYGTKPLPTEAPVWKSPYKGPYMRQERRGNP